MRHSAAIAAVLVLAACSDNTPKAAITADNGTGLLNDALCAWASRCGQDSSSCGANADTGFDSPAALFASVKAGAVSFEVPKAESCLSAIRNLPCDAPFSGIAGISACQSAFVGKIAAGGKCVSWAACGAGTACLGSGNGCDGACKALEGGACRRDLDCSGGRVCEGDRCAEFRPAGGKDEPCGTDGACGTGLVCSYSPDSPGNSAAGKCIAPPGNGEPCVVGSRLGCADAESVCVPTSDFRGATCRKARKSGESCELAFECGGVTSAFACFSQSGGGYGATSGSCVRLPASGPCALIGSLHLCDSAASFCDNSALACTKFRAAGEACSTKAECGPPGSKVECRDAPDGVRRCAAPPAPVACAP